MRKRVFAPVLMSAAALAGLSTPASAVDTNTDMIGFSLRSANTGKCLSAVPSGPNRVVGTTSSSGANQECLDPYAWWDWRPIKSGEPKGTLKNRALGKCLDSNSSGQLYFSDCSTADSGQWFDWEDSDRPDIGFVDKVAPDGTQWKQVTAWNDGTVSVAGGNPTFGKSAWLLP